ncbi:MAG: hypothetical protein II625_06895 [Bacilli bacterium]|nr:hypothetical protein [Bacilli bacterium]
MKDIIDAFHVLYDEDVLGVEETKGSQNDVYVVTTIVYKYIVKKFKDGSESAIKERNEQLRISRIWDDNNIRCIQPLSNIFSNNGNYYIIYPCIEGINLDEGELSLDQIKTLARVQAKTHLMNIETTLPCHIKELDYTNNKIQKIINACNNSVEDANNHLCVCNNDFKPLNILWCDDNPYMVDFDAVYLNNPTYSLVESAYTLCHKGAELNLDYFREYVKEYKKAYGKKIEDIDGAVYGSWNGKIQWLRYLEENRPEDPGIEELTNQMANYQKYVNDIVDILEEEY